VHRSKQRQFANQALAQILAAGERRIPAGRAWRAAFNSKRQLECEQFIDCERMMAR